MMGDSQYLSKKGMRFVIRRIIDPRLLGKEGHIMGKTPCLLQDVYRSRLFVLCPILRMRPILCADIHIIDRYMKRLKGQKNAA
jgi:hypothetical protein